MNATAPAEVEQPIVGNAAPAAPTPTPIRKPKPSKKKIAKKLGAAAKKPVVLAPKVGASAGSKKTTNSKLKSTKKPGAKSSAKGARSGRRSRAGELTWNHDRDAALVRAVRMAGGTAEEVAARLRSDEAFKGVSRGSLTGPKVSFRLRKLTKAGVEDLNLAGRYTPDVDELNNIGVAAVDED